MSAPQERERREQLSIEDEVHLEITENAAAIQSRNRSREREGSPTVVRKRFQGHLERIREALAVRAQREFAFRLNVLAWPLGESDGTNRAVLPVRFAPGQTVTSRGHGDESSGWQRTVCIRSLDHDTGRRLRESELVRALLAEFGERIDWFRPAGVSPSTVRAQDDETRGLLAIEDLVRPNQRFTWERDGQLIRNLESARETPVHQCAIYPDLVRAASQAIDAVSTARLLVGEPEEPRADTREAEALSALRGARGEFVVGLNRQTVARLRNRGWPIESVSGATRAGKGVPPDAKGHRLISL